MSIFFSAAVSYKLPNAVYVLLSSTWGSTMLMIAADLWFGNGDLASLIVRALLNRDSTAVDCSSSTCTALAWALSGVIFASLVFQACMVGSDLALVERAAATLKATAAAAGAAAKTGGSRALGSQGRVLSFEDMIAQQRSAQAAGPSKADFNYIDAQQCARLPLDAVGSLCILLTICYPAHSQTFLACAQVIVPRFAHSCRRPLRRLRATSDSRWTIWSISTRCVCIACCFSAVT